MNVMLIRYVHGPNCCGTYASFVVKVPIIEDTYAHMVPRCAFTHTDLQVSGMPLRTWEPTS